MELFNSFEFTSAKSVAQQVWKIADVLRNEPQINDYSLVLYLLSLLEEGELDVFGVTIIPVATGQNALDHLKRVKKDSDLEILKEYEYQLRAISPKAWTQILQILFSIDRDYLSKNYSGVFDEVLTTLSSELGRMHVEPMLPVNLTKLMAQLADVAPRAMVFNPFAGVASFAKELPHDISYFGQEIDRSIWALGALRLKAHGKYSKARYLNEDSLIHWPIESRKFDLFISSPPFGLKLENLFNIDQHFTRIENFILSKGSNLLKKNGKMLLLVPQNFLFSESSGYLDSRKAIVDKGYLRKVISFPAGTLKSTAVKFSIIEMVLEEATESPVVMMDAEEFVTREGRSKKAHIDVDGILNALVGESSSNIKKVNRSAIRNSDYILEPGRYLIKQEEGLLLQDICRFVEPGTLVQGEELPFVAIADLKDGIYDHELDIANLPVRVTQKTYEKIDQSCILVAMRSSQLKPTYFSYSDRPIAVAKGSVAALQVIDTGVISNEYLLIELRNFYVLEQVKAFNKGATIPYLTKKDLQNIRIQIPTLEEQRAKVEGVYQIAEEIKKLEVFRSQLGHESAELTYQRFSSIKHALGTPLMNLGRGLNNIELALDRKFENWRSAKVSEALDISLDDTFRSMHNILTDVHSLLNVNDQFLDLNAYKLEEFDFLKFIKSYQKEQQALVQRNISVILESSSDIRNELANEARVNGNKNLLKIALDNIVTNAIKHGFGGDSTTPQKILFFIDLYAGSRQNDGADDEVNISLQIRNTGKRFPDNFDLEKFKRAGGKAGENANTGQGGYQINEIIKFHNAGISTLELDTECAGSEYSTAVSFSLPILK